MSTRNKIITAISSLGTFALSLSEFQCSTIFDGILRKHPNLEPIYESVADITRDSTVFWMALALCVLAIVLNVVIPHSCKDPLKEYLDDVYGSNFAGAMGDVRVTIFKISYGIRLWPKFVFYNLRYFIRHWKRHVILHHIKVFPWKFWKKYASFYVRRGKPLENGTLAIFNIANQSDEINGVVSKSLFKEEPIAVSLPDMSNIDLSSKTINKSQKKTIDDYMKKGFVCNFDQVRAMHFYPTRLSKKIFEKIKDQIEFV